MGQYPTQYSAVEQAQLNVANPTLYPGFAGNVFTTDTRFSQFHLSGRLWNGGLSLVLDQLVGGHLRGAGELWIQHVVLLGS